MARLDLVIFGATGFTGKHAAEEMVRIGKQRGLSWGVAGRSRDKLQDILKEISKKTGEDLSAIKTIVADVQNEQSLKSMCEQARVLASCCGPYSLHGEAVVRAAIQSKTHYVDCSGEPNFIELMQLKYDQEAREAGVYIVSACAFESIPADLGVLFLQQNFDGVLNSVECYMTADLQDGSINSGTWQSLIHSFPHFLAMHRLRKKIYPTPLPKFAPQLKHRFPLHKRLGGWCLPLPSYDSAAVYRTQRYFYEKDHIRPAQTKTYIKFQSFISALTIALCIVFLFIMSQFKLTRNLVLNYSNIFSFGVIKNKPSKDVIENARYEFTLCGVGWDKNDQAHIDSLPPRKTKIAKVSGKNPGYGMTVMGVLYSAIAILEEKDKMPTEGGVITPGIAFNKTSLLKNLQENGVAFEIVHDKEKIH
ncbi:saccharopine dehydrogenase-like oxidoreductase [Epargyreus clarus]|uniref:saccharopine dehydrogenase-like oxidoreductase n=1 Tax=Epargyreus clarus TaxID=520877 RepID=UPI003C2AF301